MTLPVQRMINSICSKQLSLITKRTIHQEAKHPTIDALGQIKRRRHEYLGHILRLDPSRLLHRFIAEIPPLHKQGSLTSEVTFRTLDGMKAAARDRDGWRKLHKRKKEQMFGSHVPLWGQHRQGSKVEKVICPEIFILCTQRLKKSIKTTIKIMKKWYCGHF